MLLMIVKMKKSHYNCGGFSTFELHCACYPISHLLENKAFQRLIYLLIDHELKGSILRTSLHTDDVGSRLQLITVEQDGVSAGKVLTQLN